MDMTVSPDLEAFYCYGIVFALGLVTAWAQVSRRLGNLPGQWIMISTWLLFFAYAFVPVALFWFLDRTSALHDTSLFAAVLVGIGYQQILSGNLGSIRSPGEASKLWQPFVAWADGIAARIRDRVVVNNSQFDERLLSSIRSNPKQLASLRKVAMVHATDPNALQQSLTAIDANREALGDDGVPAKQAEFLYNTLKQSSPQNFQYLLYKSGVIPRKWYWWYAKEWRSKTTAVVVAIILILLARTGISPLRTPENVARYYIWRLQKANATDHDHFRAREALPAYLAEANTPAAYVQLTGLLRSPGLPVETADVILTLLVRSQQLAPTQGPEIKNLLAESLRADNVEVRTRVQTILLYLARERGSTVPTDLQSWQPDPKNTVTDTDQIIKKWKQVK
jgi:hypothetical protein